MSLFRRTDKDSLAYFQDSTVKMLESYKKILREELFLQATEGNKQMLTTQLNEFYKEIEALQDTIKNAQNQEAIKNMLDEQKNEWRKNDRQVLLNRKFGTYEAKYTHQDLDATSTVVESETIRTEPNIKLPASKLDTIYEKHLQELSGILEKQSKRDTIQAKIIETLTKYTNLPDKDKIHRERVDKVNAFLKDVAEKKLVGADFDNGLKQLNELNTQITTDYGVGKGRLTPILKAQLKEIEKLQAQEGKRAAIQPEGQRKRTLSG